MIRRSVLACLALLLPALACHRADAATSTYGRLTVLGLPPASASDSARFVVRWTASRDSLGTADHYRLQVFGSTNPATALIDRTGTATADTIAVARPAAGDSVRLTAVVTPIRSGVAGPVASVAWTLATPRPPQPPPAVDSLRVDSLASLDIEPHVIAIAIGDSVELTARGVTFGGDTVPLTTAVVWTTNDDSVARLRPEPGTPRVWVIGLRCSDSPCATLPPAGAGA